tara:strand:- start:451 stop:750 length:300 start_codon:yes stop_codon:yes gene_type:complete
MAPGPKITSTVATIPTNVPQTAFDAANQYLYHMTMETIGVEVAQDHEEDDDEPPPAATTKPPAKRKRPPTCVVSYAMGAIGGGVQFTRASEMTTLYSPS